MGTGFTLDQWRAAGQWLTIGGHRIFTAVYGSGQPVLALHGFPTASYDYARLVPLLADRYRLIVFDFLGYGFSAKPRPHRYSLFEQADIAEAVAVHYGVTQCYGLTHDMGNSVTLELLRRGRLRINKLVMLNGSVLLKYYQPLLTQRLLLNSVLGPLICGLRLIRRGTFARQFGGLFAQFPPQQEIDDFWALVNHNDGAAIYHRLIQYLNERKIHELTWLDALQQHHTPLTVIWGQRDPVSVPKIAEAILERRPDAHYVPLADVGHYPQWEAPERVAEAIRAAFE
jgi:pimeloyl-ACP methyl ester carboxylesterase